MFNALLVDDNASYRHALTDVLFSYFPLIGVDEPGDGEEALSKVEYQRPDLIIMDIELSGENGLEVTRKIKRIYSGIVIVILSSYGLTGYRRQAIRNGADSFVSKGDDSCMEDILARVEEAMVRKPGH